MTCSEEVQLQRLTSKEGRNIEEELAKRRMQSQRLATKKECWSNSFFLFFFRYAEPIELIRSKVDYVIENDGLMDVQAKVKELLFEVGVSAV